MHFMKIKSWAKGMEGPYTRGQGFMIFHRLQQKYQTPIHLSKTMCLCENWQRQHQKKSIRQEGWDFGQNCLVKVFDVIQMDKTFMIMQLCKCDLSEYLDNKKSLKEQQILSILKNIIQALLTVQKYGYHFADLKPQNILITQSGDAKLGDLESLIMLHKLDKSVKLKFHNSIFGTLCYMPPQLIGLGQYSSRNYVWSLGVILHEIIYARLPFQVNCQAKNLTQDEKQKYLNEFYQSLFNIKICQNLSKQYPKCHFLLKKMLRFNAKNRIDLENIYKILSDEKEENKPSQMTLQIPQTRKPRSNSQNTIDTADDQKNELMESSIKLQNSREKQTYINKNQKQDHHLSLFYDETLVNYKDEHLKMQRFYDLLKETYESQTRKLIESISSPIILVKKLNQLQTKIIDHLSQFKQNSSKKQLKDQHSLMKSISHEIKTSKAYSHLQTTIRIENLQIQFERNHRETTLWNHLNQVIQMAQMKLLQFQLQGDK